MPNRHAPIDRGDGGHPAKETPGDYEILASGGALWLLPCVTVLLFALAPFGGGPLPADRLVNLATALDDPTVAEIPMDGETLPHPDPLSLGEAFRELSSDYGATDTGLRSGRDLTIGTADGAMVGSHMRASGLDSDRISVPMGPSLPIEGARRSEQVP